MFNDLDVIWVLVLEGETPSTNSLSQLETEDDSSLSDCQQPTVIFRTIAEFSAVRPPNCSVAGLNNLTQINRLQLSTLSFGWPLVSQCSAMPDQKPTGSSAQKEKTKKKLAVLWVWLKAVLFTGDKIIKTAVKKHLKWKTVWYVMQQYDRWTICLTYGITVPEPLANVLLRHLNVHSGGEVFFPPLWGRERPTRLQPWLKADSLVMKITNVRLSGRALTLWAHLVCLELVK